jgi:hypothetical protein
MYVYKNENGDLEAPSSLPQNFKNVSNFPAADPETILEQGWYVYTPVEQPVFDESTHTLITELVLENDVVRDFYVTVEKTQEEKDEYTQYQVDLLNGKKHSGKTVIDENAENARLRYITGGSGQAAVYMEKAQEAVKYAEAGYPVDLTEYPFIQADVAISGETATDIANLILAQKAAWVQKGAEIEQHRLQAKRDIDAAVTIEEVDTIVESVSITLSTV